MPHLHDPLQSPPLDATDLAVRLETQGITDSVARTEYGYADVWHLAASTFEDAPAAIERSAPVAEFQPLIEYLKGISFALPLAISCAAMLVLRFSLWGGNVSADAATAIGLGVISSFTVTGGFIQAMARRGLFYIGIGQMRMCERSAWKWVRRGVTALLGFSLLAALINAYFGWLPLPVQAIAVSFVMAVGLFCLSTGILYLLEQNLLVGVTALIGLCIVACLHFLLRVQLLPAQVGGIVIASGFAFGMAALLLRRKKQLDPGVMDSPPWGKELYFVWPYFVYGVLYYAFLFSDRILAWTSHADNLSMPVQFRGDYESALDVGLFAFVLQVGWAHYATIKFYRRLRAALLSTPIHRTADFNRVFIIFYRQLTAFFITMAALISPLTYTVARTSGLLRGREANLVAIWSLIAYAALVLALCNVNFLFTLSQPIGVLQAIAAALALNIAIGYLASRIGGYPDAVFGFAAGALAFAGISMFHVIRTFRRLDYFQFAAIP